MPCARSLRDFVAQRPAGDVMTAEERAALEEPTAIAKKEAVAAARVAAAEAAKAAAEDAARRRYGLRLVHDSIPVDPVPVMYATHDDPVRTQRPKRSLWQSTGYPSLFLRGESKLGFSVSDGLQYFIGS